MKLSVEVNGNVNRNLMIFANPLEVNPPSPTDPNVIYLGPDFINRTIPCQAARRFTSLVERSSRAAINMNNATNAKVIGRGVLDRPA